MSNSQIWFFFNKVAQQTVVDVEARNLTIFLSLLKNNELVNWLVWREGLGGWQPVIQVEELVNLIEPLAPQHRKQSRRQTSTKLSPQQLNNYIHNYTTINPDRRQHLRYNLRLRTIIISGQLAFRSFTSNISIGGMCLELPLPSNLRFNECEIYLANPENTSQIKLKAKIITNTPDGHKHICFCEQHSKSYEELTKLLF
jgi:hypothetical protein